MTVRVGVLGTSWWVDAMHLPSLVAHPDAEVVGVCGRDPGRAADRAQQWGVGWSVDPSAFLDPDRIDAVVVATPDDSHEELALTAIDRGIHLLCEKPVALTGAGARRMADAADAAGLTTLVPFTYRYMPSTRWVRRLIDEGYVGTPYHLGMRYFAGYARDTGYAWRFDHGRGGSGVLGDLGSHWLHVARWLLGEVTHVGATTATMADKADRPDGSGYERANDVAQLTVRFENGATGWLLVSAVCWEGTEFGQVHELDLHGTDGTLRSVNDWTSVQEVRGVKAGEPGPAAPLPIPDHIWGACRRERVRETYQDVFRVERRMVGDWIDAIVAGGRCDPDLAEGARVQELLDAAALSAADGGRLVEVPFRGR
jgi:predicted dehydrogenase